MNAMESIQHNPIRPCPCSSDAIGCGYHNMDLLEGCPFDCSYCILQTYLPSKKLKRFSFSDTDLHQWLAETALQNPHVRLGTGELADSLAFEPHYALTTRLIAIIREHPGIIMEWKTKSICTDAFLQELRLPPNIVVSWSLNPQEVIASEEGGTPALKDRLMAMKALSSKGVPLGIHLDPIILLPKWRSRYERLIQMMGKTLGSGTHIAWISLGTLRYPSSLRPILLGRPPSHLFYAEQQRDGGGKYRYHPDLRIQAYRHVLGCLDTSLAALPPVYLCMEQAEIWAAVFGMPAPSPEQINRHLFQSVLPFSTRGEKTVEIGG